MRLPIAVAGDPSSGYVPGTPGAPWTDEEVKIVQEKVRLTSHESECRILIARPLR